MKLGKKRVTIITSIISIALLAGYLGLRAAKVIGEDQTWLPWLIVGAAVIGVKLIQKRVDPESYKADLIEMEKEEKAEEEIRSISISRTWGGTICEFITAVLLIVSWLLILRDYSSLAANGEELKIAGLLSVGAIWLHVSAYFHKTMGFPSSTVNQLKMCIYRKRALGLFCAIFLICGILIPDEGKMAQWLFFVMGLTFVLLFASKFVIGYSNKDPRL